MFHHLYLQMQPKYLSTQGILVSYTLLLCVAVRILASREISMTKAHLGHTFLTEYMALLALKVHLVNHHMAMHYLRMIKLFGPVYGWWLFAFEGEDQREGWRAI